jgi:hypothetical protein
VPLVAEAGVHYSAPRWSPDGRWIAAERVALGTRSSIALIEASTGRLLRIVSPAPASRSLAPAWMPDGRLLFSSDRGGAGFRIFVADVERLTTSRLEGTGAHAAAPEPSRDGRTLVFVGYTPDGYDLFEIPIAAGRWTPIGNGTEPPAAADVAPPSIAPADTPDAAPISASRAYSPRATIAPRFWTPTLASDSDELVVGAATVATDALGRHAYAADVGWSAGRGRPDWQVAYAYDRWRPTLFANVADDTDPFRDGEVRTREGNAGVLFPVRRVRWSQSLLGAFHSSTEDASCAACGPDGTLRVTRRALRAGWLVNASRSYGYSISREEGWNARATIEVAREDLGADADAQAGVLDVRGYVAAGPRHAVLAARAAGAASWGEIRGRRRFSASGPGPQELAFDFGGDAIGLVRGLGEDALVGTRAAVVNVDYRFPLMRIDRGVGTWPAFARVVHGALFVDAGHAWDARFERGDVRFAVGGEIGLDAVLGYVLPVTFTAGVAWVSHDRGAASFVRIGRGF